MNASVGFLLGCLLLLSCGIASADPCDDATIDQPNPAATSAPKSDQLSPPHQPQPPTPNPASQRERRFVGDLVSNLIPGDQSASKSEPPASSHKPGKPSGKSSSHSGSRSKPRDPSKPGHPGCDKGSSRKGGHNARTGTHPAEGPKPPANDAGKPLGLDPVGAVKDAVGVSVDVKVGC